MRVLLKHSCRRYKKIQTVGLNIWPPGLIHRAKRPNNDINRSNVGKANGTQKHTQHIRNTNNSVRGSARSYNLKCLI
jgi:hypothetical protein